MTVIDLIFKNCGLSISHDSLCIYAPSKEIARQIKRQVPWLALQAKSLGKRETRLSYPGCRRPYVIPACFANSKD
jgi:hypothetical protein